MANNVAVDFILDVDDSGFNGAMASASKSVKSFLGTAAGLIGGSAILGGLGKSAISMAADFDQGFAKVSTLFGDVAVDTDNLKSQILDLSTQTGIAATELNEGLYSALSAGIPVTNDMTEAMDFLEQATKLSVAGFTSTEKAVDVATTVLNAYGLEASETERVMNTLIETQNAGKTTVDELASSMGKAIPSASALGVNFEELSAAMAVLTANGINTAESTTMLAALFKEMADNGADVNTVFKEISGTTIDEYIKAGGNLQGVLEELNGYLEDQNMKWGDILSSSESVTAAQTLMKDGGVDLADTYARLSDDTYELNDAYETMQTPLQKVQKLQEAWKNELIKTGDAMLEKLEPAIDWAIENIDILVPLVLKLAVGFGLLLIAGAVASAVNSLTTAFGGLTKTLKLVGSGAKIAKGALLGVNGEVGLLAKGLTALGPTGAIVAGVAAGAVAMGIAFDVDFAKIARDAIDGVMKGITGLTQSQRDYKDNVAGINQELSDEITRITEETNAKVENGEMTSAEARAEIAEKSVDARLEAEKRYNDEFKVLQNERYAEEQVASAKATGKEKELLDSSEQELLDIRESYNQKTQELKDAAAEGDVGKQEELNNQLAQLETDAGEEMLILKAGNRAKDEENFITYTDNLQTEMADMSEKEKENYQARAEAGKAFRDGEYNALLYAHDQTKQAWKNAYNDQIEITTNANGSMTTIVTDELGNQLEVTKTKKGEINSVITDAQGKEVEGTKRQKEQLKSLETQNWTDLLTISAGGGKDIQESMNNMWDGILNSADTSNKKLQNKAVTSGTILAQQWLDNGNISVEQYDSMISQLDDVTQNAVDEANRVDPAEVKGNIDKAKKEFNKLPAETQKAIRDAEAEGPVKISSLVEEVDNTQSVWQNAQNALSNLGSVKVKSEVVSNSGTGTGNGIGPTPQSATFSRGARGATGASVTSGQAGLGRVNRLNNVSLQSQAVSEPDTQQPTVVYNTITLDSNIEQVNDVTNVDKLGEVLIDVFDQKIGRMVF